MSQGSKGGRFGCAWGGALAVALAAGWAAPAWGQALPPVATPLRVVAWNVTNYGTTSFGGRDSSFQTSFYGVVPAPLALAGQSMYPDVIVGQEFLSAAAVANFRNILNSAAGSPGDWVAAPFRDGPDTDSALFFRSSKVNLLDRFGNVVPVANLTNPGSPTGNAVNSAIIIASGSSSTANQPRNTIRYDIVPVGYSGTGARMALYSIHLKAQGSNSPPPGENAQGRRLVEVQRIRANAAGVDTNGAGTAMPAGYHYMILGDTNIQNSNATDYQAMVGPSITGWLNSSGTFVTQTITGGRVWDPIVTTGTWNNNSAFRFVHTQDPAGQMDDRYDQILMAGTLLDGNGLDYRHFHSVSYFSGPGGTPNSAWTFATNTWNDPEHTYRCWGNDGSSFDLSLTRSGTPGNTMVGNTIATALHATASSGGHMPVLVDLVVPAKSTLSSTLIDFGTVNVGDVVTQTIDISNGGEVGRWTAGGIAPLSYTLSAGAPFSVPAGPFTDAAGGGVNTHTIGLDTTSPGTFEVTMTVSAPGDVDNPTRQVTLRATVTPATPSCPADYNRDTFLTLDDLGDFITDFYMVPAIPGGLQPSAPTYPDVANVGYGVPCEFAGDAPSPYAVDAYRVNGYRVGYSGDGSNACPLDAEQPFPNLDNLNDYITFYYASSAC
jgi:hypothetical protein